MKPILIVDKNDNPVGSEHRSKALELGLIHRIVRVILVNKNQQVLLQWRDENRDTFPNTWDQSAGGHVDEGENYEDAVYRELKEELGLAKVKLTELEHFYTDWNYDNKIIKRWNKVYIGLFDESEKIILQDDEVKKVEWFNKDEIEGLMNDPLEKLTPSLKRILIDFKEIIFK